MALQETLQQLLDDATKAIFGRYFYTPYPEHPSPKVYGETADAEGLAAYEAQLGNKFVGLGESETWVGQEKSPYSNQTLGVTYPSLPVEDYIGKAKSSQKEWSRLTADQRANLLVTSINKFKARFFEIAYATMHTTGQGYMMSFQASGPHAADRSLEAIAMAYHELTRFAPQVEWEKPAGKTTIKLQKRWKVVPKGINLVIGCSTFPTWNSVPGLYAGLMTGNPVIVKPHPSSILPIAIIVAEIRNALIEEGINPDVCQLAPDTLENPVTIALVEHEAVKLIDYTGGSSFGNWIESVPNKITFTEKAGINAVILESATDLEAVVQNLAFSICLYSGQMCTAPQNFFVPAQGIQTSEGPVTPAQFADRLALAITALVTNPKVGPTVLGAIQNPNTLDRVKATTELPGTFLVLSSNGIENPQYPDARTASPTLLLTDISNEAVYGTELFGPIAFVISCPDANAGLHKIAEMVASHGAISCGVYSNNEQFKDLAEETLTDVGAPVSFNLVGGIYLNQHAGFSDFHVTGANPAGNASFTNPEFVIKRFNLIGVREPIA